MAKTKSSGTSKDAGRRAVVEQMRREQQSKERRKTFMMLGAAILVGAIIIGTAVWQLLREQAADGQDLAVIGAPAADAGCQDVRTKTAEGEGEHRPTGERVLYEDTPPAYGPHWANSLTPQEARRFYTAEDRPEVERLVHSLEHGWTVLWYDETIADDDDAVDDLRAIAGKFPEVTDPEQKIIIAPWTSEDTGDDFPGDTHLAFTHWSAGADGQEGVWQYCEQVSGAVVVDFMDEYPSTDSPEGVNPQVF